MPTIAQLTSQAAALARRVEAVLQMDPQLPRVNLQDAVRELGIDKELDLLILSAQANTVPPQADEVLAALQAKTEVLEDAVQIVEAVPTLSFQEAFVRANTARIERIREAQTSQLLTIGLSIAIPIITGIIVNQITGS